MKKYNYIKVIQQHFGHGWEDVSEYEQDDRKNLRADFKEYKIQGYPTRIISRRELTPEYIDANLKECIQRALNIPDEDFHTYCSDLHLLYTEERRQWLKENYKFYQNVTVEWSNVKGQPWYGQRFFDIPFAAGYK